MAHLRRPESAVGPYQLLTVLGVSECLTAPAAGAAGQSARRLLSLDLRSATDHLGQRCGNGIVCIRNRAFLRPSCSAGAVNPGNCRLLREADHEQQEKGCGPERAAHPTASQGAVVDGG